MRDAVKKLVPGDRFLMGFDFLLIPPQTIAPAIATLDAYPGFADHEKFATRRGHALRLFSRLAMAS